MNKENLLSRAEMKKVLGGGDQFCNGMTQMDCYFHFSSENQEQNADNPHVAAVMDEIIWNNCQQCMDTRPI